MHNNNSNKNCKKQERFHKLCQVMLTEIFTCYQGPSRQELIDTQTGNRDKRYSWKAGLKLFVATVSMPRSESTQINKLVVPHPWRVCLAVNERQGSIIVCVAHHARLLGFNPQLHIFPVMSPLTILLWVRYGVTRCRSRERKWQTFVICHTQLPGEKEHAMQGHSGRHLVHHEAGGEGDCSQAPLLWFLQEGKGEAE